VILLGWSQGGMFLVKYLIENRLPFVPKALILVAAPYAVDDFGGGEDGGDFGFETERLCELHEKVQKIIIVHSEDDFVVPFAHAEKYHRALPAAELMVFKDKNHFLIEAFPELVEKIRQVG
jgi:predicted alpha/beta hydrolase family esterase